LLLFVEILKNFTENLARKRDEAPIIDTLWRESPTAAMPTNQGSSRAAAVSSGFSFEGDSLPDFSEFDSNSVVLDFQNER
jgi:hypothetical protein